MTHVGSEWGGRADSEKDRDETVRMGLVGKGPLVVEFSVYGASCLRDIGGGIGVCLSLVL